MSKIKLKKTETDSPYLRLLEARKALKLSQKDLAEALNLNQAYISELETGRKNISVSW